MKESTKKTKLPSAAAKVIKKQAQQDFPADTGLQIWRNTLEIYEKFVRETPDIGEKKNMMWDKLYASLGIFAYYEAANRSVSLETIGNLTVACFMGDNQKLGKLLNFNWRWFQKLNYLAYKIYKK